MTNPKLSKNVYLEKILSVVCKSWRHKQILRNQHVYENDEKNIIIIIIIIILRQHHVLSTCT